MSKALKRFSVRDSLAKTVRLMTKQGVPVQFRGSRAYVAVEDGKVVRMNLPEINDDASERLLASLHGYLDHECAHIFYTPFSEAAEFAKPYGASMHRLQNIIEDIRIERLIPRDLPGTKENLGRLYERIIPEIFAPAAKRSTAPGSSPTQALAGVMIPGLRALAGDKAFKQFMDANNYWPFMAPILKKIPDLARLLRGMETFAHVQEICIKIHAALTPPAPDEQSALDAVDDGHEPQDVDQQDAANDADDGEGSDETSEGGEGSDADGEGDDDGEGADDDSSCGGDEPSDESGTGDADGDDTEESGDDGEDSDDTDTGSDEDGDHEGEDGAPLDPENTGKSGSGKANVSITDALKQLEPTQRRAIFLYKKKSKSIAEIASELAIDETETREVLRTGRRRLMDIMVGD